jgi:ribosomal protein S18 acetylase RimI-like enzyme
MVAELAQATASDVHPQVTGDGLRADLFGPAPLLRLVVAEGGDGLAGCCLSLFMFSTWRGTRGLHVIDLYVRPAARNAGLGELLLIESARRGWQEGARFIRLEVERGNDGAERFYKRLGFQHKDNETLFALYQDEMTALTKRPR